MGNSNDRPQAKARPHSATHCSDDKNTADLKIKGYIHYINKQKQEWQTNVIENNKKIKNKNLQTKKAEAIRILKDFQHRQMGMSYTQEMINRYSQEQFTYFRPIQNKQWLDYSNSCEAEILDSTRPFQRITVLELKEMKRSYQSFQQSQLRSAHHNRSLSTGSHSKANTTPIRKVNLPQANQNGHANTAKSGTNILNEAALDPKKDYNMWSLFKITSFLYKEITSPEHMIYDAIETFKYIFVQQYDIFYEPGTLQLNRGQSKTQMQFILDCMKKDINFVIEFLDKLFRTFYLDFFQETVSATQAVRDQQIRQILVKAIFKDRTLHNYLMSILTAVHHDEERRFRRNMVLLEDIELSSPGLGLKKFLEIVDQNSPTPPYQAVIQCIQDFASHYSPVAKLELIGNLREHILDSVDLFWEKYDNPNNSNTYRATSRRASTVSLTQENGAHFCAQNCKSADVTIQQIEASQLEDALTSNIESLSVDQKCDSEQQQQQQQRFIDADNFASILLYCVIKAKRYHLRSNWDLVYTFCHTQIDGQEDEAAYLFATLEAIIEHITQLDRQRIAEYVECAERSDQGDIV